MKDVPYEKYRCKWCRKTTRTLNLDNVNFCGACGQPSRFYDIAVQDFLTRTHTVRQLPDSCRLVQKHEYVEATRTAVIALESLIRSKSNLDMHGVELVSKAFSFEYNLKGRQITRPPVLGINELKNQNDRNEQEGMMHLLLGVFLGIRNLLLHNHEKVHPTRCIQIIITCQYLMDRIEHGSLLQELTARLHKVSISKRGISSIKKKRPHRGKFLA